MKTNKKMYSQPQLEVVKINAADLIATSDPVFFIDPNASDFIESEGIAD